MARTWFVLASVLLCAGAARIVRPKRTERPLRTATQMLAKEKEGQNDNDARFHAACAADGGHFWAEYQKLQRAVDSPALIYTCVGGRKCSGIGNQLRGVSVAFYVALVTRRAFYIQLEHPGIAHNKIDWRLPNDTIPNTCKKADALGRGSHHFGCTRRDFCKETSSELLYENASCLHISTNAVPSIWWEHMVSGATSDLLSPVSQAVVQPEFMMGCAMNFLFNFSVPQRVLEERRSLSLAAKGRSPPSSYIALHMRLGDSHLRDVHGPDKLLPEEKEKIRAGLRCAHELGEGLFTTGERWGIFVASDSPAARRYAFEAAAELNVSASENEPEPMHAEGGAAVASIWDDFLTFLGASGLVSAGGLHSASDDVLLTTNGFSDYSQAPAQHQLLPFSRQRVVTDDGACNPVSPKDVQNII